MNQESRTLFAITFLLAALFVAMNRIVESAPLGDWWLALALFVIGAVFALATRLDLASGRTIEELEAEAAAPALPRMQVFEFASAAAAAPQLAGAQVVIVEEEVIPADDSLVAEFASDNDLPLDEVIVDEPAPPPVNDTSPEADQPEA